MRTAGPVPAGSALGSSLPNVGRDLLPLAALVVVVSLVPPAPQAAAYSRAGAEAGRAAPVSRVWPLAHYTP